MSNFACEEKKTVMSAKNADTSDQEFNVQEWIAIPIRVCFGDIPDEHGRVLMVPAGLALLDPTSIAPEEALESGRSFVVRMSVSRYDLVLTSASAPPSTFLEMLPSCKAEIVKLLRGEEAARANDKPADVSAPGWRKIF
jgi:hypothetical protein